MPGCKPCKPVAKKSSTKRTTSKKSPTSKSTARKPTKSTTKTSTKKKTTSSKTKSSRSGCGSKCNVGSRKGGCCDYSSDSSYHSTDCSCSDCYSYSDSSDYSSDEGCCPYKAPVKPKKSVGNPGCKYC